jgi:hypothetical protein
MHTICFLFAGKTVKSKKGTNLGVLLLQSLHHCFFPLTYSSFDFSVSSMTLYIKNRVNKEAMHTICFLFAGKTVKSKK